MLSIVCLITLVPPAIAEDDPVLREKVIVHNDVVTLGDLFENAGIRKSVAVFQSPQLGTTGVISTSRVGVAAQRHGLIWLNPGGVKKIVVERPSRFIPLKEIKDLLTNELAEKAGIENRDNADIIFARGAKGLHLDKRNNNPVVIVNSQLNLQNGIFRAVLGTEELSGNVAKVTYNGRILRTAQAVVPNRVIEVGSIITADDIKTEKFPANRIKNRHIKNKNDIIGKSAKRALVANIPVSKRDIEIPKIIKKNEIINIQFKVPGLSLRTKGKALNDGAKGDEITIMNLKSKRKIQAIVISPGAVSVSSTAPNNTITNTANIKPPKPKSREAYIVR